MFEERNLNLFSFILTCYKEIYNSNFNDIFPKNKDVELDYIICGHKSLNFPYFYENIKSKGLIKEFHNKKIISQVLLWLDANIYYFDEWQCLPKSDKTDGLFEDDIHYLIIQSRNSISKQINKYIGGTKGGERLGLRSKRFFDPLKNSVRLGLRNLVFLSKQKNLILKQKYVVMENLSNNLQNGIVNLTFYPTVCKENFCDVFRVVEHEDDANFTIEYLYKNNRFINTIKKSLLDDSSIKIFPEIVAEHKNIANVQKLLSENSKDLSQLFVLGTTWANHSNVCIVIDENGEELLQQQKIIPYVLKEEDSICGQSLYEDLDYKQIEVSLLHVVNFGIVAFPICSDLTSNKYIESIFCECGVDMLILPCLSKSDDIFSSLGDLSSRYWMTIIACNTCFDKIKYPALVYLPWKIDKKRETQILKQKCRKLNKCDYCSGIDMEINIFHLTKTKR